MFGIETLFSSSSGNCTLVTNGERFILIDAGVSAAAIKKAIDSKGLSLSGLCAVFLTHEHSDHTKGIEVLSKKADFKIYASVGTLSGLLLSEKASERCIVIECGEAVTEAGMCVVPFRTSHDAAESFGYSVYGDGRKLFGYATDTGCITEELVGCLSGCVAAVVESNHDEAMLMCGPYPYELKRRILSDRGHLSNESCAELISRLSQTGTKKFILAHLSEENNMPSLALATAKAVGAELEIAVAPKGEPSETFYA